MTLPKPREPAQQGIHVLLRMRVNATKRTVRHGGRDGQGTLLALTHFLQTLLPTADDLVSPDCARRVSMQVGEQEPQLTSHREGVSAVQANGKSNSA